MDGHYVPNLTFGPKMVEDLHRATTLPLDVHLMIERPEIWVDRFVDAGASYVTVHIESTADAGGALARIRERGVRPGITLVPETPLARILPYLLSVDLVLVMSVKPGFGGQPFIESSIDKIRALRAELDTRGLSRVELEVDGGIKAENARRVADAGATVLVAGSAIFLDPAGPHVALAKLKRAASG